MDRIKIFGLNGINDILISAIKRKNFLEDNLCFNNFDIYSGPLHIITLPKYMNIEDSNSWTKRKRIELEK